MTDRTPSDIEKTVTDVLSDLRGRGISGSTARQIRDAADGRVRQTETDESFHRAVKGGY